MKKFYPVIHCHDIKSTIENTQMCLDANTDGLFLINHGEISDSQFREHIEKVQNYCTKYTGEFKIGVNFLNLSNISALKEVSKFGLNMLWVDNAECDDVLNLEEVTKFWFQMIKCDPESKIDIFGGVHFKYQEKPKSSIEDSIKSCVYNTMYPTLSGPATGKPADLNFIQRAYDHVVLCRKDNAEQYCNLAIASGISIENVDQYIPYIEYFLVASSLLAVDQIDFDNQKLKTLSQKIHNEQT